MGVYCIDGLNVLICTKWFHHFSDFPTSVQQLSDCSYPIACLCRVVTRYIYFFVTEPIFLPKMLIPDPKNDGNFDPWARCCYYTESRFHEKHCWSRSYAFWFQILGLRSLIPALLRPLIPDPNPYLILCTWLLYVIAGIKSKENDIQARVEKETWAASYSL